jgi:hypothetical protein
LLLRNIKRDMLLRRLAKNRNIGHNEPTIEQREKGATPSPTRYNVHGHNHTVPLQKDTGSTRHMGTKPPQRESELPAQRPGGAVQKVWPMADLKGLRGQKQRVRPEGAAPAAEVDLAGGGGSLGEN